MSDRLAEIEASLPPVPTPAGGPLRLDLRAWNITGAAGDPHPVARSLAAIADALGRQYRYSPQWDKTKSPFITPVRDYLVGNVSASVKATLAAMAVILLIACANVAR